MKFAKKSLGQNFLVDKNIIKKIIKKNKANPLSLINCIKFIDKLN